MPRGRASAVRKHRRAASHAARRLRQQLHRRRRACLRMRAGRNHLLDMPSIVLRAAVHRAAAGERSAAHGWVRAVFDREARHLRLHAPARRGGALGGCGAVPTIVVCCGDRRAGVPRQRGASPTPAVPASFTPAGIGESDRWICAVPRFSLTSDRLCPLNVRQHDSTVAASRRHRHRQLGLRCVRR